MSVVFNPFTGDFELSGSASNSFATIQTPNGTSPTALSGTDTLIETSSDSSLTITGNSGTNTVDYIVNATNIGAGILPIARGGTNSGTALSNNRVMQSSGGKIQEAAAITASRALISDANGIPTQSATTSTELGYLSGAPSNMVNLLQQNDLSLAHCIRSDFDEPTIALISGWQENKTGTGAGAAVQTSVAGHNGIVGLNAGTTATGIDALRRYQGSIVMGAGACHWRSDVLTTILSAAGTCEYVWRVGLQTNGTVQAGANTDGVWFEYNRPYTFTVTGTTTNGQTGVTGLTGWTGVIDGTSVQNGMAITGTGIQAATTVSGTVSGTSLTLSQTANASGTVTLTITVGNYWIYCMAVASTQYRQVTSQAVAASTWYILDSVTNAAGTSSTGTINGGASATIAQTLGATAIGPVLMMYNTAFTSGAPIAKHDYFGLDYIMTSTR